MKDITTDLFKVSVPTHRPVCGGLLVAEPFMKEPDFNHGVVSLVDYVPDEGATGVVMNNRTEYMLDELLDGIDSTTRIPVFCGGPVGQDRLFFIHTLGSEIVKGARRYAPGLYVGGDFDAVIDYVNAGYDTEGIVRFFVGYSNWVEGQLEKEIRKDSWAQAPSPANPAELLTLAGDAYWHRAVGKLGSAYRSWTLIPRHAGNN